MAPHTEANQDSIGRLLNAIMRAVEFTRRLAGEFCKEIAVGYSGHRAKYELRSHLQHLVTGTFLIAASRNAIEEPDSACADCF